MCSLNLNALNKIKVKIVALAQQPLTSNAIIDQNLKIDKSDIV